MYTHTTKFRYRDIHEVHAALIQFVYELGNIDSRALSRSHMCALSSIEANEHSEPIGRTRVRGETERSVCSHHDDVIKWKHFPRYCSFLRGIQRSPVNSPHRGQWRGTLMYSLIRAWINGWVNNRETGDSRRHGAHNDVTVMICILNWRGSLLSNSIFTYALKHIIIVYGKISLFHFQNEL